MIAPEGGIELRERRTVNSKHYDMGDGTYVGKIGVGHQHFLDKLDVGDGQGGWQDLDWTLVPKEEGGWTFLKHSFNPDIPQYADDWLSFRDLYGEKDQIVGFKPVCSHVEGRLVRPEVLASEGLNNLTAVNAVVYDSAFGEGIDYVIYFTRSQMLKCVRIKDSVKEVKDYSFKFELQLPDGVEVWRVDAQGNGYKLNLDSPKDFDSDKHTELRTSEGETFFKPFSLWDSAVKKICVVSYSVEDGKKYLTKHVSASFVAVSEGDVFTDTTTSYYAGSGDGTVTDSTLVASTTWEDCRNGIGSIGADYGSGNDNFIQGEGVASNDYWVIRRVFFPVDTSGIGAGRTVSSATFQVFYGGGNGQTETTYPANLVLVEAHQASYTALAATDFLRIGSTAFATATVTLASFVSTTSATFTLNSAGVAHVNRYGYTTLGIRPANDVNDTAPTVSKRSYAVGYFSEQTGTSKDPVLSVTYADGVGGNSFLTEFV